MNVLLRILAWILAVVVIALPVVAVVNGWVGTERWPLSRMRVTGEFERVNPEQLRAAVMPYARRGFFAIPLQDAQTAVERLPWVETAQVRKQWPDVLEIHVVEHKPFARWGDDRMLSVQGRIYPIPAKLMDVRLPRLYGPTSKTRDVIKLYNESCALFSPIGLEVLSVTMDDRGSWSLRLSNGTEVVIGRSDADERLSRFVHVLPQLLNRRGQVIERADLRYTNGFALRWAEAPAPALPPPLPAPLPLRYRQAGHES
ncbi:MAG: cell division protein FtsQ/DivIB [Xanthomonadaceae bacterium]|jgi:cell division protein FtsQ|nr:cell division protein FtsQ/DivIB [Xanthomonadaceae bacterium]